MLRKILSLLSSLLRPREPEPFIVRGEPSVVFDHTDDRVRDALRTGDLLSAAFRGSVSR